MSLKEKRIGVLMGGASSERNVSLRSGMAVFEALKDADLNVVSLEIKNETEDEVKSLLANNRVDLVFIAMHGGFGEDGRLQHILEEIRMPFTGPKEKSSRLAMDKFVSRKLFEKSGLLVPAGVCLKKADSLESIDRLHFPLVIKPVSQGSSIGISFVGALGRAKEAVDLAFQYDDTVLVEEFIKGREITVSVLDGKALPIVEIIPKNKFFDFQAKYEKGMTDYVVPADLSEAVTQASQKDAVNAYRVLDCRHLSRVDIILKDDVSPYVLEVNTIPGFTATSLFPKAAQAQGMSFKELCTKLLEFAVRDNG